MELCQHIRLYIFNGLSPSSGVENKYYPQQEDPVHGNDFMFNSFGTNAEIRHQHFKTFLSCQNPEIDPPPRSKYPNWKMRPILKWMNFIFKEAWLLGHVYSIDEMTMCFQGLHKDKRRIVYMQEGDGFQCDSLCQDDYCYQFYFRNHLAPSKHLNQGMSLIHARVMSIFDSTTDNYHVFLYFCPFWLCLFPIYLSMLRIHYNIVCGNIF